MLVEVVDLCLADGGLHRDRRQRIGGPARDLARELTLRDVQDLREAADDLAASPFRARHVADPELDGGSRDVRDDHAAVAVEDRPARRLLPHEPDLVVLGRGQVLVAREHLERPEPEEEDPEDHEGKGSEDPDPERQRRRQPVGLTGLRIRREEPSRSGARLLVRALRQRAPPPPTAGKPCARRRST